MTRSSPGKVYLVGAGPGDPELLTVKAQSLIRRADIILHDGLVPHAILSLASPDACVVNAGKRCGAKKFTQAQINALMIHSARQGMMVVRLKSGDPGIFGRLAEELDALEAAHVSHEIVPGITAAVAAAACAGISLTDRRKSSRIVIVSGHHAQEDKHRKTNWSGLAGDDMTLVVYMPGQDLSGIRTELLEAGLVPETPALIVSGAATPHQRRWLTTVGECHTLPPAEPPAILIVGRSVGRADHAPCAQPSSHALAEPEWNELLSLLRSNLPTTVFDSKSERRIDR